MDETPGRKPDETVETEIEFWQAMNFQRENWGALKCHVVFFLQPDPYLHLLRVADHLASWIMPKLHLVRPEAITQRMGRAMQAIAPGRPFRNPDAARRQLEILQEQLASALEQGVDPMALARRYYLPMLEAALDLHDLKRAKALREKMKSLPIPQADKPKWLRSNFLLDIALHDLKAAGDAADNLLQWAKENGDRRTEAEASHHLGMIAQEQRDFKTAEQWSRKALAIAEKQGNEHDAAASFDQLGRIAQKQRDFKTAEQWFRKVLAILEKTNNERDTAATFFQLGIIAHKQRDFKTAEQWYRKSLAITEKQGIEYGAASAYHQLGIIALEQRDFKTAEQWCRKAMKIFEKLGDEHSAAITCAQLGLLTRQQRQFIESVRWLIQAVRGFDKTHDPENRDRAARDLLATFQNASSADRERIKDLLQDASLSGILETVSNR